MFFDTDMFLVYRDESGNLHYQPWQDLPESGTLIDPYSGDDMELVGWFPQSSL